jgi:hypothetical protein
MNNITVFIQKLRFYFMKIIQDLRQRKYDYTNVEQNMYFAMIMIIFGVIGLILVDE